MIANLIGIFISVILWCEYESPYLHSYFQPLDFYQRLITSSISVIVLLLTITINVGIIDSFLFGFRIQKPPILEK